MTFTVTYRDQRGAKREEAIEAESRGACVASCRARGISPLSIRAGGRAMGTKGSKDAKGLKGVLTALSLLALLGGTVWWWFGVRGAPVLPDDAPIKPRGMPKEVKPAKVSRSQHVAAMAPKATPASPVPDAIPAQDATADSSAAVSAMFGNPFTNRMFKTTTEQVLGHLFMTRIGDMPFPVPNLPQEELAKIKDILERDVPFKDSDDAHALDTKETVAAAKKEFAAFLADGGKPQDFVAYYHEVLRKAFEEYMIACNACEKVREEQPELYDDFLERVNKRLASKGIKQVERESDEDEPKDKEQEKGEKQ